MDEETIKAIAAQLRCPNGEYALSVAEKMNEGNLHINLSAIEALNLQAGDRVLEIGMGNGHFVKNILEAGTGITYAGCDFSQEMVDESIQKNYAFVHEGSAGFYTAPAEKLPFENDAFDKILTLNTIYFWENDSRILSELWRVLKPGGRLVLGLRPRHVMEHYPFTKYGFRMFNKDEIETLFTENNFTIGDVIERDEPDQEINGEKIKVEMLIVSAEKQIAC